MRDVTEKKILFCFVFRCHTIKHNLLPHFFFKSAVERKLTEVFFVAMSEFNLIGHGVSLGRSSRRYQFQPINLADVETILCAFSEQEAIPLLQSIKKEKGLAYGIKFQLGVRVILTKYSDELMKYIEIPFWFLSDQCNITSFKDISKQITLAIHQATAKYDSFVQAGSGWSLTEVKEISLTINTYNIIRGGCQKLHKQLPPLLRNAKRILSLIDNNEKEKCFIYAVASSILGQTRNSARTSRRKEKKILQIFDCVKFKFPFKLTDVRHFEKQFKSISVNVYGFENHLYPFYISPHKNRKFHVNLLLHNNHYFSIKNLSALLSRSTIHKINRRKTFICTSCLSYFYQAEKYQIHTHLCQGKGPRYQMPTIQKASMSFSAFTNLIECPFVMYCDLESLIEKEKKIDEGKMYSARLHTPISVGALTVCRSNPQFNSQPFLYTGKDCIRKLLDYIHNEYDRICQVLDMCEFPMQLTPSEEQSFYNATHCQSCYKDFVNTRNDKVRDHDHLSGKFRKTLCNRCNLTYAKKRNALYVFFHGLSNYDLHFIIQEMHTYDENNRINIIPKTSEKYLSLSVNNIHLKDSYQFLQASLSELAKNLKTKGNDMFKITAQYIKDEKKRDMFFQKGIYPYSYMDNIKKLDLSQLPLQENFTNDLTNEAVSDKDYAFAKNVWNTFECKTMKDYMELYLLSDILLLSDIFENFRDNCFRDYELDPVYYFSAPHFTFDAFLRKSRLTLDLISDVNQYLFYSQAIRGGLCQVIKRYAKANNPHTPQFNPNKKESYILYIDANNLYGKAMMDFLPYSNFQWMDSSELNLNHILNIKADSPRGCIVQCDLEYPEYLHDNHVDFPLAPHKLKIKYNDLSPLAKSICLKHNLKRTTQTEKLMTTFYPKENYILHYKNLQLYVQLGIKVTRIHRGIKFKQAPIMKSYVDFNSMKRAQATNSFDTNFYKLLSNSLFGKTIERPEKRSRVILTGSKKKHEQLVGSLCYKQTKIINPDLVGITMTHPTTKVVKPCYLGISILELSKWHMYNFFYNVLKKYFKDRISLLYTDTDSFILQITCSDLYETHLPKLQKHFDFSNYPTSHALYSSKNKRVPGLFKDEAGGKHITEFVGLRSKMYSFILNGQDVKVAKGVKKNVIEKQLQFSDFKRCLFQKEQIDHDFKNIVSKNHRVYTLHQGKTSLSPFDDKRYLLNNVCSLPYGHYTLKKRAESKPSGAQTIAEKEKKMARNNFESVENYANACAFRGKAISFQGAAHNISINVSEFQAQPWVHIARRKPTKIDRLSMKGVEFCSLMKIFESEIFPQIEECQKIIKKLHLTPPEEEDNCIRFDSVASIDDMKKTTKKRKKQLAKSEEEAAETTKRPPKKKTAIEKLTQIEPHVVSEDEDEYEDV